MYKKLHSLYEESGRKVSVIGWSLGGIYARFLGKHHPDQVRNVITLGSPITGHPKATNAWQIYEWASGQRADDPLQQERVRGMLTMPSTSIFSRSDGIVAWNCSRDVESAPRTSRCSRATSGSACIPRCCSPWPIAWRNPKARGRVSIAADCAR